MREMIVFILTKYCMVFLKKIAIVWFQGEKNIPKAIFKENLRNWRLLNPDWQVDLVDESMLKKACRNYSKECLDTFNSFELLHMKIDFARYVLLYNDYSMYVDMDMYALRSLDNSEIISNFIQIAQEKDAIGLSTVNLGEFESLLFSGKRYCINNAMMMASHKNPIIKELVDKIIKKNNKKKNNKKKSNKSKTKKLLYLRSDYYKIQNITGPSFINKFFNNQIIDNVIIFPHYIFEPTQPFGDSDIRDETVAIHAFQMTWISDSLKNLMAFYFCFKPILLAMPFIFIFYLFTHVKRRS
jgi:mannosyltransferase OCH1-like enzyme